MKTWCFALFITASIAQALASNGGVNFTFKNNSHYLFMANNNTPACAAAKCPDVVGPGQSETFSIPNSGGLYIAYNYDAPDKNYFGFYVQNQNGTLTINPLPAGTNIATSLKNNTLTVSSTDKPVSVSYPKTLPFRGINLSGAEAGSGQNFMTQLGFWIPSYEDAAPYLAAGANTVRFPIRWGYITDSNEPGAYLQAVYDQVQDLLKQNVTVILDLHNYMRQFPIDSPTSGSGSIAPVTAQQVGGIWSQLATTFKPLAEQYNGQKGKPENQLIFEVMNEPNTMATQQVVKNNNAGIAAIRKAGLSNLVLVEGNGWSGLHSWESQTGTDQGINANSMVAGTIVDPDDNWAVAVHQYFDTVGPYSGTGKTCVSLNQFKQNLNMNGFLSYVHSHHIRVMLDEFGVPAEATNDSVCQQDLSYLLTQVTQNGVALDDASTGGFIGWTAWQVGHGYSGTDKISPAIWASHYQSFTQ